MSVASEIERIKGNIASAYTAAGGKGATMPSVQNSANLAGCIDTITGGGGEVVDKTKFGVSIDDILGDTNENGYAYPPQKQFEFDATGIKRCASITFGGQAVTDPFAYKFYNNIGLVGTVDLSGYEGHLNLASTFNNAFAGTSIERFICPSGRGSFEWQIELRECCQNAQKLKTVVITSTVLGGEYVMLPSSFKDCISLDSVEGLGSVTEIRQSGLARTFEGCVALTTADTSNIKTIVSSGMQDCFKGAGIVNADLSGLTSVNTSSLSGCYSNCLSLKTANLSNVIYVGSTGLSSCFYGSSVEVLDVSSLQEVASSGMISVCRNATSLTTVAGLGLLEKVGSSGFEYAFNGCTSLTGDFVFTSLTTLGDYAFRYGFQGCTKPLRFFFPALITLGTNPFGTTSSTGAFRNATGVTEIHFRADMQSQIESLSQYSSKWGATNATIYFDL